MASSHGGDSRVSLISMNGSRRRPCLDYILQAAAEVNIIFIRNQLISWLRVFPLAFSPPPARASDRPLSSFPSLFAGIWDNI
jgi:hypothetical protein